jgi:adenylate cyclase
MIAILIWKFGGPGKSLRQGDLNSPVFSDTLKSIAILPFKNMSGDPDHEYMCDGLTEEIIYNLSLIKSFSKVISRSSVMAFKNSPLTIPEIAQKLKVNTVLEGSFRKAGNQVRITNS